MLNLFKLQSIRKFFFRIVFLNFQSLFSSFFFLNLKSFLNFKFSKLFLKIIISFFLILNFTFAQNDISNIIDTGNFKTFANSLTTDVIATIGTMMMAAAFGFFFYGIAKYIFERAQGKDSGQEAKKAQDFMLWGLIALFVMVSAWGIIKMAQGLLSENFAASNAIPIVPIKFQVLNGGGYEGGGESGEKKAEETDPAGDLLKKAKKKAEETDPAGDLLKKSPGSGTELGKDCSGIFSGCGSLYCVRDQRSETCQPEEALIGSDCPFFGCPGNLVCSRNTITLKETCQYGKARPAPAPGTKGGSCLAGDKCTTANLKCASFRGGVKSCVDK